MKQVLIRVDASLPIGSGHVMRCLSLAAALRERGAAVHFASRLLPGHINAQVERQGFPVHALPAPNGPARSPRGDLAHAPWLAVDEDQDIADTRAVLERLGPVDTLVVDHYALDARWQSAFRPQVRCLAVLDDLGDRAHAADVIVDQNVGAESSGRYDRLVPPGCVRLLGPGYALLRAEFAAARARLKPRSGELRRVMVFLGGVDNGAYTERAMAALAAMPSRPQADVIVGYSNPRAAAILLRCRELGLDAVQGVDDMAARMALADFAIGAGGTTTWERACMGLPSLVLVVADNQRAGAQGIAAAGCAVALEGGQASAEAIRDLVERLAREPQRLRDMQARNLALVDGRGAARVARTLLPPSIDLRRAVEADRDALFAWRNDEAVRRHSHSSAPIERTTHDRWFSATLANPQRDLLIAAHDGAPAGVLRYDVDGAAALVSIYLVPGQAGQGLGPAILRAGSAWLRRERPALHRIRAEIHADNPASLKAFREAGYTLQGDAYYLSLTP